MKLDLVTTDCEDLACHTGATYLLDLQIIDECTDIPDDLTGYAARMLIYDEVETTVIFSVAGTITTPKNGLIHFEIDANDTDDLVVGIYSHIIEISIGTMVYRIANGDFEVVE
jgi:hypothetical protein